jgi:heterodisulfide reductase subunit A-like polyferredoxin
MKSRIGRILFVVCTVAVFAIGAVAPGESAPPKKWDLNADVVVVGAGGAGLAAAVSRARRRRA